MHIGMGGGLVLVRALADPSCKWKPASGLLSPSQRQSDETGLKTAGLRRGSGIVMVQGGEASLRHETIPEIG